MLTTLQRIFAASNRLEAKLYPPLGEPVIFRTYQRADHDSCLAIYRKNEPGRFPDGHITKFEAFLQNEAKTLIVAELDSNIVAYGGIYLEAPSVAVLCYNTVAPEFQGHRIGTTLTLLRIAQLPSQRSGVFVVMFALDASMPFHRRFGFAEKARWKAEDGKDYPVAILRVSESSLQKIKSTLHQRGIHVRGGVVLGPSGVVSCRVVNDKRGEIRIEFGKP